MKTKIEDFQEDNLFEMSNFRKTDTGLPVVVWVLVKSLRVLAESHWVHGESLRVSNKGRAKQSHVKVQRTYTPKFIENDSFSISITDEPKIIAGDKGTLTQKDLDKISTWIILNQTVLLNYWNGKISTVELVALIKKLPSEPKPSLNKMAQVETDMLVEVARINDKNTFPCDVIVYGGISYGSGRNECGEPHFLYKKDGEFDCKVAIPTSEELNSGILRVIEGDSPSSKKMKELLNWIKTPNFIDTTMSNYRVICLMWNVLNTDNNNVRQVDLPKE